MVNTVAWFEVASDDPEAAQRFYGDLFGWTFTPDPDAPMDYRMIHATGEEQPGGGLYGTGGEVPNHATFCVLVEDVAATCAKVESLGGKVVRKVVANPGGTSFAYLHDVSGNLFGIFTPPAG
ncbi:VOC family protein [Nonomuraea sp. NPDC004354]